jgi:hypothetical protein
MIFTVLLVGLPVNLLCLSMEIFTTWWCIRYYIRRVNAEDPPGVFVEVRPLLIVSRRLAISTSLTHPCSSSSPHAL